MNWEDVLLSWILETSGHRKWMEKSCEVLPLIACRPTRASWILCLSHSKQSARLKTCSLSHCMGPCLTWFYPVEFSHFVAAVFCIILIDDFQPYLRVFSHLSQRSCRSYLCLILSVYHGKEHLPTSDQILIWGFIFDMVAAARQQ